jgi:hypothetical protein
MQELVPVAIGVVVGLFAGRRSWGLRAALAAAPVLGGLVSWAVGELAESIAFAVLDTAVIAVTAVIVVAAQRLAVRDENGQRGGARWLTSLRAKRM